MCRFSRFSPDELILAVQTANGSIKLYKYLGMSGFQYVHTIEINDQQRSQSHSIENVRSSFSLVESGSNDLNLIVLNTADEIGIIECVFS